MVGNVHAPAMTEDDPLDTVPDGTILEIHDLRAPTLSGIALRAAAYTLESPWLGAVPRNFILRSSFIVAWRADNPSTSRSLPAFPTHPPPNARPATPETKDLNQLFYTLTSPNPPQRDHLSIASLHHAYATASSTPSLIISTLERFIEESNRTELPLNALRSPPFKHLQAEINASTERWAAGRPRSVLDGAPFSAKFCIDIAGLPSSGGTRHEFTTATNDAPVVSALRQLGMLPISKSNQDELALGTRGFSLGAGSIRNPHNPLHCPGGSSGGCASAVAAGLVPVSLGSDSGGSVRIPAACCGIFGLKPTFSRISAHGVIYERDDGVPSPVRSLGILAASADDLALVYYALATWAPCGAPGGVSVSAIPAAIPDSVRGLKIGVYEAWNETAWKGAREATENVLSRMREGGATVKNISIPHLEGIRVANSVSLMRHVIDGLSKSGVYNPHTTNPVLGNGVRLKLAVAREFNADDEMRARLIREKAIKHALRLFEHVDVIITPTLAIRTPKVPPDVVNGDIDIVTESAMMRFTIYANFTGLPALSFPAGKDDAGLPLGVQAIAAPWKEDVLIRIARWSEQQFTPCVPEKVYNALHDR